MRKNRSRHFGIACGLFTLGLAALVIGFVGFIQYGPVGFQWMIISGTVFLITGVGIIVTRSETDVSAALQSRDRVGTAKLSKELNMVTQDKREAILDLRDDDNIDVTK